MSRLLCCLIWIVCFTLLTLQIREKFYVFTMHTQPVALDAYLTASVVRNRLVDMQWPVFRTKRINRNKLYILFLNAPPWINLEADSEYLKHNCYFNNCIFTRTKENVPTISAVVFSTQGGLNKKDVDFLHSQRSQNQIWVFFRLEAPTFGNVSWYRDPIWRKTMNWSWGYRLDSDIFRPMQALTTRTILPDKDYRSIYLRKKRLAAWIVSHCNATSLRDEYVSKLIQSGVQVDIFGLCSENRTRIGRKLISDKIDTEYMFYLSFENNICKEYISEKFYYYFSLDTVLVVRGGLNYSEHFDKEAFIDTSDFPTVKSLALFMLNVSRNITLYTKYLKHKDKYNGAQSKMESIRLSECQLCEKLNNKHLYKKVYDDIATYLHNGTCRNPTHIL